MPNTGFHTSVRSFCTSQGLREVQSLSHQTIPSCRRGDLPETQRGSWRALQPAFHRPPHATVSRCLQPDPFTCLVPAGPCEHSALAPENDFCPQRRAETWAVCRAGGKAEEAAETGRHKCQRRTGMILAVAAAREELGEGCLLRSHLRDDSVCGKQGNHRSEGYWQPLKEQLKQCWEGNSL